MAHLLSLQGRVSRGQYAVNTILIPAVLYIVLAVILRMEIGLLTVVAWGLMAVIQVAIAFQAVKRLHDIGRPSVHFWLLLVPFYNMYLTLLLLFKKGEAGANAFGSDPLDQRAVVATMAAAR